MRNLSHNSILSIFVLFCLATLDICAQSACEINDVHTNPNPIYVRPQSGSGQPSYRTNHFDWRAPWWPIGWTELATNFVVPAPPPGANYKHIESPFFAPIPWMGYIGKEALSDFHPRDGWELVSMDFGMENSVEPIRRTGTFVEPHLLLYNKHTSVLRFLLPLVDDDDASFTSIELRLEPRSDIYASGLFAGTGGILNPLDSKSPTRQVTSRVKALDLPYLWNHVEVPVFYDPCSCMRDQSIQTRFRSITEGELRVSGLYGGTIIRIDASTGSAALPFPGALRKPDDYLWSMNGRNLADLKLGAIVAKNVDALRDNYQQWVKGLDGRSSGPLFPEAFNVLTLLGDTKGLFEATSFEGVEVRQLTKNLAIGSRAFSMLVKSSDSSSSVGQYLASYSQDLINFSGSLPNGQPLAAATQHIALPGTPWTLDDNEVAPFTTVRKPQYPLYNETLGLFAFLHAPKVKVRESANAHVVRTNGRFDAYRHEWRQYQFDGSLDYVWNPASRVDVEDTRMYAALIIKQSKPWESESRYCSDVVDVNVLNAERLYDADVVARESQSTVYATNFVGLECLSELPVTLNRSQSCIQSNQAPTPGYFRETDTVVVRLVMDVRFLPNEYGVRNRSLIIYTLPVDLVAELDTLVGNGIVTQDDGALCGKPHITPYAGDLSAFCSSNQYKAKELSKELGTGGATQPDKDANNAPTRLQARLELRPSHIEIVSESSSNPIVVVLVYDVLGKLVNSATSANVSQGATHTLVSTAGMVLGAYIVVVTSGSEHTAFKILYAP